MNLALVRSLTPRLLPGVILLLAGCATAPPLDPEAVAPLWRLHLQALQTQPDWTLTARFAAHTEEDSWSGDLHWHQGRDAYQLQFSAPFGQGAMQMDGDPQQVVMRTSDGQQWVAEDAESLLFQQWGWHLPLASLQYWVRGMPVPNQGGAAAPVLAFDEAGRLARLTQSDWEVEYPAYQQVGAVALPRKVYLENPGLSVRLVIDQWELGQSGKH